MKKTLVALLMLISVSSKSQTFFSLAGTNKGAALRGGYLHESTGIELSAGWQRSLTSKADRPVIGSIELGYKMEMTDAWSATPSIGIASYSSKDLSLVKTGGDPIQVSKTLPIYRIEIAKEINGVRLFSNVSYCNGISVGVGLRGFIRF